MKNLVRAAIKNPVRMLAGAAMRNRPLATWPRWAGDAVGIKVPANVRRNPAPSPLGSANINIIRALLDRTKGLEGDIAECGVFQGATLVSIALWAREHAPARMVFGCDSFQGFDQAVLADAAMPGMADDTKRIGGFSNTSAAMVARKLALANVADRATLVQGYYADTLQRLSERQFSFVHLDCDLYSSYKDCLDFFYPRLVPGGIILFDEYNDPPWPGCNQAVDEFLGATRETLEPMMRDNYEKYFVVKRRSGIPSQ
jgi:hypothetical protein